MQHMLGYFKRSLDDASRTELAGAVADYQQGLVPLIVPITLFRHHVRCCGVGYLQGKTGTVSYQGTDAAEPRVVKESAMRLGPSCLRWLRMAVFTGASLQMTAPPARAQDAPQAPPAEVAPPAAAPRYREIGLNGLVSVSYVGKLNSPASGKNQFRVFDADNGTFKLDVAELDVQRAVSESRDVGFRVDIAFGSISGSHRGVGAVPGRERRGG